MNNFTSHNPTKLIFGEDTLTELPKLLNGKGKNILLVYGDGSIKRNGLYANVLE